MSKTDEYKALAHAVQTGVAYDLEKDSSSGTPKHLRTGINLAMCNHAGLVKLLIDKGLITTDEYEQAIVNAVRTEKKRYEDHLSGVYNAKITLG